MSWAGRVVVHRTALPTNVAIKKEEKKRKKEKKKKKKDKGENNRSSYFFNCNYFISIQPSEPTRLVFVWAAAAAAQHSSLHREGGRERETKETFNLPLTHLPVTPSEASSASFLY